MKPRGESGLTLLECAAALAIAALVLVSTSRVSQAAATLLRRARVEADLMDVVRNLLEHELGSPCGAGFDCPDGYRCTVTRSPVTAAADRVTASVERTGTDTTRTLSTLAPVPSCGA